jgi:SAM-dependent methyltransferase
MTDSRPAATQQGMFWDQRYGEPGFAFGEAPNAFLVSQASVLVPGGRALVPGDGEGRNGVWLASQGMRVTTVDASPIGVSKAQRLAASRGVRIDAHCADLATWDWPVGTYDLVVSIYLHFAPDLRGRMHAAMVAALAPGGRVLLEGYTPRQLVHRARGTVGGPPDPAMLFEPDLLRADFAGMTIERLEETEVDLAEGSRHVGRSAVARLVARRT